MSVRFAFSALALAGVLTAALVAQPDDPCRARGWHDDDDRHCEVREHSMGPGPLTVDAGRNGGIRTEYPLTVQGELSFRRGVTTTLGAGGAPIRVRTTNGGVRINRR